MFKFSKDGISILASIDPRRPKTNGLFPIKIQVVYHRTQKYYPTGKEISKEEWSKLPDTKSRKLLDIRESVENSFSLVKMNVEALAEKGGFSFDSLNLRLGKANGESVNNAFRAKIESLKKEERIGTMMFNENVLIAIEKFGGPKISFEAITVEWLKSFEKNLLKNGNSQTTIGMNMRGIRAIVNDFKKAGIIKETQYPFGKDKYEIKKGESHKKAINLDQIEKIFTYTDSNETTLRYRDLWIFMYLCNGINVADLVKLKYNNIKDGEISFIRQKTERTSKTIKEIRAVITPSLQTIIDKWGNGCNTDSYIFPYVKEGDSAMKIKLTTKDLTRRINKRMRKIGEQIGIADVTTYTARHSFATVLKRSGANIAFISESLGHNDLKTTESYLASFEKEEREKNASFLTRFR